MPELCSDEERRKRQLECLRLACDLTQLAESSDDPDIKMHFRRMADLWTGHAQEEPSFPQGALNIHN